MNEINTYAGRGRFKIRTKLRNNYMGNRYFHGVVPSISRCHHRVNWLTQQQQVCEALNYDQRCVYNKKCDTRSDSEIVGRWPITVVRFRQKQFNRGHARKESFYFIACYT